MQPPDLSTSPGAIWRLTWPQMLMMYIVFFMGFMAVWVAGQIGADVQAALGMVTQCSMLLMVVIMSIASGATAAVSQSMGASRLRRACRYIAATVIGSMGLGLLMAVFGFYFGQDILKLLSVPVNILPVTEDIWQVNMLALPAQYIYAATGVMFRATRQVMPPLWVAGLVCTVNFFACLGLGLGWFGMPVYGYMGLAWANFCAQCLGAICNCLLLIRSGYLRWDALPAFRWLRSALPYLIKVALPAGTAQIVWQSGYLMLFVLVGTLPYDSVDALAGLTAGQRAESLLFLPAMAFHMSASVLVGNCLGAGKTKEAKRVGLQLVVMSSAGMSLIASLLWPFRQDIAMLLTQDMGAQAQIVSYLTYNLLSTPFSIASTVMGGIMLGAGATHYNLMIYGGSFWLVRLPLGWLLGHHIWQSASGIFAAMLVSQCLQTCIMLHVVLRCNWARFAMRRQRQ